MNDDMNRFSRDSKRLGLPVALLVALSASCAFAQPAQTPASAPASASARVDAPDGAPQLTKESTISNTSTAVGRSSEAVVTVDEERVQGRLATAKVSVAGGKGYTVVDPAAGHTDRPAGNAGKRVSPSLWELLRF
jgi:hypothetical protein